MRKLIYLLLAAAVFFLAGVYQSEIFMILFLAEGMLFLLFFLLSRWGTGNVETEILTERGRILEGERGNGQVKLRFKRHVFIPYCRVLLMCGNHLSREEVWQELSGAVTEGRKVRLGFSIEENSCGIVEICAVRAAVCDPLRLFFRKRSLNAGTFLTVLSQPLKPPAEIAEIEKRPGGKEGERIWEKRAGAGSYEGIRTYQPGDSMRDIHWKLSSKNDELLSRRYMEEGESGISFYLDVSGWKDGGWKEQSAFLRLAFTISREGISTDYVLEEILDRVQRPVKRPAAAGILLA